MTEELKKSILRYALEAEPFDTHNHITFTAVDDGYAQVTLEICPESLNRWGAPHGGAVFTICDVACGVASVSLRQETCVTLNTSIRYMAAAGSQGRLIATGRVQKQTGKMSFCTAQVHDEAGRLIAAADSVMYFTGHPMTL